MHTPREARLVAETAIPLIESLGLVLWGVELAQEGRRRIVRLYVDTPGHAAEQAAGVENPAGPTIDDLATVSRTVSLALDVDDPVSGTYSLEVSSPGLERPFFSAGQMAGFEGRELMVTTEHGPGADALVEPEAAPPALAATLAERKKFRGELLSVDAAAGSFVLSVDTAPLALDFAGVRKAHLVHHFPEKQGAPKPKEQKKPKDAKASQAGSKTKAAK